MTAFSVLPTPYAGRGLRCLALSVSLIALLGSSAAHASSTIGIDTCPTCMTLPFSIAGSPYMQLTYNPATSPPAPAFAGSNTFDVGLGNPNSSLILDGSGAVMFQMKNSDNDLDQKNWDIVNQYDQLYFRAVNDAYNDAIPYMNVIRNGSYGISTVDFPSSRIKAEGGLLTVNPLSDYAGTNLVPNQPNLFGGSPQIFVNGDDHTGGGIAISNDGGFYDYNDGWITYNGGTGLMVAGPGGQNSSGAKLQVNGQTQTQTLYATTNAQIATTVNDALLDVSPNIAAGMPTGWSGIHTWDIYANGSVGVGSGGSTVIDMDANDGYIQANGYFHNSDERLKQNIQTAPGLDLIAKLRGVTFNWKKDGKPSAGVIAQEIEKVMPGAVHDKADGYKTVEYDQIIGPMIESIKELQAQNKAQQAEIDALRKQVGGK